jgi:cysteine synthase B
MTCQSYQDLHDCLTIAPAFDRVAALDRLAVVGAIGNTPLMRLDRLAVDQGLPPSVELWLKAEWGNPGGSVKDRPAREIVRDALRHGRLGNGQVLLDATSGNTGIAYAMLGAALDVPVELVVPASASDERKRILAAYGATVILSDPYDGSDGAIREARARAVMAPDHYYYADQYNNPANLAAHERTTGPELWRQTAGRVTHLVAGLGTTGTLIGAGRFLKAKKPSISLVGVQPAESFHGIEGLKHLPTAIVPGIYDASVPDREFGVVTEEAFELARRLARIEGLFAGTSTGAALAVGRELAARGEGGVVIVIAPDGGLKYLSSGLWSGA